MQNARSLLAAVATLAALAPPLAAEPLPDMVQAELLSGWRTEDGTHMSALRLTLAPGWKTYWRVPGSSGIPPLFDWQGSRNLSSVAVSWPVPDVFDLNGVRTIGYANVVTIPIAFTPATPGSPIAVSGQIDIGVCEEVCVPMTLSVKAALSEGAASTDPVIAAALADAPMGASQAGVGAVTCAVEPISDGLRVTARIDMPKLGAGEAAVMELADPRIWVSEADLSRDGDTLTAVAELVPPNAAPFALDRSTLRFTVIADGRAVDIRGCTAS
jgi:DsbC/DsbD-like thiol-disulfide interchange protein